MINRTIDKLYGLVCRRLDCVTSWLFCPANDVVVSVKDGFDNRRSVKVARPVSVGVVMLGIAGGCQCCRAGEVRAYWVGIMPACGDGSCRIGVAKGRRCCRAGEVPAYRAGMCQC